MSAQHTLARRAELQRAVDAARTALATYDAAWCAEHGLVAGAILATNESGKHDGRTIEVTEVSVNLWRTSAPDEVVFVASGYVIRQKDGSTSRQMGSHVLRIRTGEDTGEAA